MRRRFLTWLKLTISPPPSEFVHVQNDFTRLHDHLGNVDGRLDVVLRRLNHKLNGTQLKLVAGENKE